MTGKEIMEKKREEYRKRWKEYDKWANLDYRWWKSENMPHLPDFSGTGKEWKWPTVYPTGNLTVRDTKIATDKDDRMKIINSAWRNMVMMQLHILQETLGQEQAEELWGYMWLAMTNAMEGLNKRYIPEHQERDCVMLSKQWQIDCHYEMIDVNVVEEKPERAVLQALCTYYGDWITRWKSKGIRLSHSMCALGCEQWCEEWAYKINPNMTCTRTKWLVAGDPCCEYVFEIVE